MESILNLVEAVVFNIRSGDLIDLLKGSTTLMISTATDNMSVH